MAESLLEQHGYVRTREVIAIVAGTRTKSGSTNFLRLHVLGEHNQEGVRFFVPHEEEIVPTPEPAAPEDQDQSALRLGRCKERVRVASNLAEFQINREAPLCFGVALLFSSA